LAEGQPSVDLCERPWDRPIDDLIIDEGILMRNGNGDKVSRQKTYSRVSNRENNRYVNEFDMDSD
jgi:hypothetical protein